MSIIFKISPFSLSIFGKCARILIHHSTVERLAHKILNVNNTNDAEQRQLLTKTNISNYYAKAEVSCGCSFIFVTILGKTISAINHR